MERTPAVHTGRFCKILSKKYEAINKKKSSWDTYRKNYLIEGDFKLIPLNKTLTATQWAHHSGVQWPFLYDIVIQNYEVFGLPKYMKYR